jgi:protein transport protein SEC61 subunit gamma-like protein
MSSSQMKELSEMPAELAREGTQYVRLLRDARPYLNPELTCLSRFLKRCQKPSLKEFYGIAQAVSLGFLVMGFVGFIVKLIHIPINRVLGMSTHISWRLC